MPEAAADPSNISSHYLVNVLREVSANLKHVRQDIAAVGAQAAGRENASDDKFAEAAGLLFKVWSREKQEIDQGLANISTWKATPQNTTTFAFELAEIQNVWDRVCDRWPADNSWTRENAAALADSLISHIDELIEKCALITLTPRIQEHLRTIRPGRYKTFSSITRGETVDQEMDKRLLARFAESPELFDGLIDVEHMRIARLERGFKAKAPALLIILGAFLLPIVLSIPAYSYREEIPYAQDVFGSDGYAPFLVYIALAFVGAWGHVVLKARTAENRDGTRPGAEEGLDWLALNYTSVCWSIVAVWLATVIARSDVLGMDGQLSGLVVGYSADSIVDSFTGKFTTYLNKSRGTLLASLKPEDQPVRAAQ